MALMGGHVIQGFTAGEVRTAIPRVYFSVKVVAFGLLPLILIADITGFRPHIVDVAVDSSAERECAYSWSAALLMVTALHCS